MPAPVEAPSAPATGAARVETNPWAQLLALLPRGGALPEAVWRRRHRLVLWLLVGHAFAIAGFAYRAGHEGRTSLLAGLVVLAFVALASARIASRAYRSLVGALGLITCSILLTHIAQGIPEVHFHIFVALAVITLYQEWLPFLVSIVYVVLHHGVVGAMDPTAVYSHAEAIEHPWRWALIHAAFIAAACVAYAVHWRMDEDLRDDANLLLASAGEGVIGFDLRGRVQFSNPAASAILGIPADRLVGRHGSTLFPGLQLPPVERDRRHVHETAVPTASGRQIPVECILTPSRRRGLLHGHVIAFRDVSERREAEALRLKSREEQVARLRELDQVRTQFMSNAAHELRTPLTPLGIQVEVLKQRLGPDAERPDVAKALGILRRNFERLQSLIEDMLNVSRLQAGRVEIRREPVDVSTVMAEARDTFVPLAERQGIELTVDCAPGLWVDADPLRLHQVVFNLLGNALRYTDPPGRVEVHVHNDTEAPGVGEAVFRVRDTGRGLSEEQIARLFQPFGQVHDGVPAERVGTGLGLYITRALVELHGGRIWVESDGPGKGSTFTFVLPARLPPPRVVSATDAAPAAAPAAGPQPRAPLLPPPRAA